ncbi:hypothetical protein EDD18DRAFT_1110977 [Armillaria luteobubalina]|uniref:Uncharacterized protein n=1 Tax=Armillaria luteobubalina TaxID=153913 RepID=A0AA39UP33_9AGAR|nr:hypothetical protein EDD18DRAFT_1110977 [Armillaria luteobubalina]
MEAITEIPDLSQADIQLIFQGNDMKLNTILLQIVNRNLYWDYCHYNVDFSAKDTNQGLASHAMVFVILCLYGLDILTTAFYWSFYQWIFIDNGWNFWTCFSASGTPSPEIDRMSWVISASGLISTLAADASLDESAYGPLGIWMVLYTSFIMVTTILCTLLIIYRILAVSHRGMDIRTFRGIIEIIVESALVYSITLLLYLVFVACNSYGGNYLSALAAFARGIAPTLIVGRVAAGHARPKESWEGSISSSLHFGHNSEAQSQGSIDSDIEGGTVTSGEEQSSVTPGDSSEQGQGVGGQEYETGQVVYVEIV